MRFLLMALGYSFVALVLASPLVAILSGWQHRRRTLAVLAMAIVAALLLELLFAAAFLAAFTPAEKVLLTEVTDPAQGATFFLQKLLQADSVLLILVAYPLLTLSVLAGIVGGVVLVRDLRRSHRTGANAGSLEGPSPPWWWHLRRGLATTYTLSIVATLLVLALDFGGYGNLNAREMKLSLPEARLQSTVELAPGKTMTGGTLLAHTDGYWHLLDDQGNVVSIADSEAGAGVIVISSPE
jgi:hypothetical protein